jgi:phospholipase/carboxylesterase
MSFYTSQLQHRFIAGSEPGRQVLLLVHGRGGRLPLMEFMAKRGQLGVFDILLIEAPHADFVLEMKVPGFSWYLEPNQKGIEESRAKLRALIHELIAAGYSSEKIFWMGFSQGCVIGLDLALRLEVPLGGVVGVSGFVTRIKDFPAQLGPSAKQTPILVTLGTRDAIVPPGPAREHFEALQTMGVKLEMREFDKIHAFDLKREVPQIEAWLRERL